MINPGEIPQIPGDMDVLAAHGESLRTAGSNLGWTSLAVDSTWQGLAPVYDAPEAWQLLAATGPVRTTGYDVGADVGVVGRAIITYADEVRPIQAQLQSLQSQATSFVDSVEGDDDWNEDGDKVDEHNSLLTQVNAAVAAWMDAQRTCANTINALYGGIQYRQDDGDGVEEVGEFGFSSDMLDEALNSEDGLPWGTPEEEDLPWWEDGLNMVGSFLKGVVVDGIWGTLVGLFNMVNVFDWDTFTATWAALGKLAFIITNPVLLVVNEFTAIPGFEQGEMLDTLTNVGKGLIAYDMWGEDPARAAGAVTFNIVALVGTAGVGTAATGVATTARVAGMTRTATVATRTAEIAASFPRVSSLTSGLRFSDDALRISDDALRVSDDALRISDDLTVPRVDVPDLDAPNLPRGDVDVPPVSGLPDGPGPIHGGGPDNPVPPHAGGPDTPAPPHAGGPDAPPAGGRARDPIFDGQSPHGPDPSDAKVQQEVDQVRQQLEPELQRAADDAWARAQADPDMAGATGQQLGTRAHQHFQQTVNERSADWFPEGSSYSLSTELSFKFDGVDSHPDLRTAERGGFPSHPRGDVDPARYSQPGSVRPDLVLSRNDVPVSAFDLKTGNATMAAWWSNAVAHGLNIPDPVVLRPRG